jgi:16S rRNA (guanine1207-N2)-methyltransferase
MPDVTAGEQYFATTPHAPGREHPVEFSVAGERYRLVGAGGVFSSQRLDPGTAVLLRKAVLPGTGVAGPLLDLGCGYGAIACVLASRAAHATVYAIDVNGRARDLTAANAKALGVSDRVIVTTPERVPADVEFAQIWSNPPIRIGKAELHELLDAWLPRLRPDGVAWLVVARNLGADSLAEWLAGRPAIAGRGWRVDRHASQKGYRVLRLGS